MHDGSGNIFITGDFHGTAIYGTDTLVTSNIYPDIFVAKLDTSGNWQWARRSGDEMNDYGRALTFGGQGRLLTAGFFSLSATFGQTQLNSTGDYDIYLARLSEKTLSIETMSAQQIVCGSAVVLPGSASNFTTLNWTPSSNLSDPTVLNPLASPIQSSSYTHTAEDACGQTLSEQVQVNVIPYAVDAGNDTSINSGGSVLLQGTGA